MAYTREEFVEKYGGFIANEVKGTGILSGTLISQAILESQGKDASGNYRVGGSTLARNSNNYFGIKCHNWTGKHYNISTGEVSPSGVSYTDVNACFRAYDSVEDSISDYVKFLTENSRYRNAGVFNAPTVKEQAEALRRAGYATDSSYPDKVSGIYEGLKSYIDKFSTYGVAGIAKSFVNSPVSFVKRNWIPITIIGVFMAGVGITTYLIIKNKK